MSVNTVAISGNLTRDPEMRGGTALAFGVAVNERRRNPQTQEWEDYPNYIDCVVFGNRAEALERILHKGMKVSVQGRLRWSQWEREGQKRSKIEVIVDEIEFMAKREQEGQRTGGGGTGYPQTVTNPADIPTPQGSVVAPGVYQPTLPTQQPASVYDEDIPF